jgi:hypothetical protein
MSSFERLWKKIQHKLKQDKQYEQAYLEAISSKYDKRRSSRNIIR